MLRMNHITLSNLAQSIIFWRVAVSLFTISVIVTHILNSPEANPLYGDPSVQSLVTLSLIKDGDFDLRNQQVDFDPTDQVALGKNGEWYPLHEPLLPILAVPFHALFGIVGCVKLNMIVACLAAICMFNICSTITTSYFTAGLASALMVISPPFLTYSFSFSTDLLGASMVVGSFMYLGNISLGSWFLAGLISGLLLVARTPFTVIVLGQLASAMVYLLLARKELHARSLKLLLSFGIGLIPGILAFFAMNYFFFGDIRILSYDRWYDTRYPELGYSTLRNLFHRPLLTGLHQVIFSSKGSLLSGSTLATVSLALTWLVHPKHSIYGLLVPLCSLVLCVEFALFSGPHSGEPNRYLLPIFFISTIPLAVILDYLVAYSKTLLKK